MRTLLLLVLFGALGAISPHRFYVGPEGYYLRRARVGGSRQTGTLWGAEGGYERIKNFGFYWGLTGLYAKGRLTGWDSQERLLDSRQTETEIEARLGYTLAWFTPFVGYGYFRELNDFSPPSPMAVCFGNSFKFTSFGLSARVCIASHLTLGLRGRVILMINGKCRVTEDPVYDDVTIRMNDEVHYRVELPVGYVFCNQRHTFGASLVPFWWYRHYGGRDAYPFDFIDTRIRIYGLQAMLSCYF